MQLVEGVDAIVHLGGISIDAPFDDLLDANILGTYNLYEAARRHGVKRVVFASSNHAIGFHPVTEVLDADAPQRPDSLYGVTKCFGESLSRYYFDRFGIETVCLRIGSSFEEPKNPRMLVTYLSYRDFIELVRCSLFTNRVGHAVVYGASDNPVKWWDNAKAGFLGFNPQDSSAQFAGPLSGDRRRPPIATTPRSASRAARSCWASRWKTIGDFWRRSSGRLLLRGLELVDERDVFAIASSRDMPRRASHASYLARLTMSSAPGRSPRRRRRSPACRASRARAACRCRAPCAASSTRPRRRRSRARASGARPVRLGLAARSASSRSTSSANQRASSSLPP